eukprot:jgi/Botrbrau1/21797/Bobra.0190s0022.1
MLSSLRIVDSREAEQELREMKKAKKKEKKKLKKEKKKAAKEKVRRNDEGGSSSAGSGESENEDGIGFEADSRKEEEGEAVSEVEHRESWMTTPMARADLLGSAKPEKKEEPPDDGKPKIFARELNKTLLEGGAPSQAGPGAVRASGVGDGGASWRMKALRRAQATAEEQGLDVREVVGERWGSLAALTAGLAQRRAAPDRAHVFAARERQRAAEGTEGAQKPRDRRPDIGDEEDDREGERAATRKNYLGDVRSARSQMRRPDESRSLSWRRPERGGPSSRDAPGSREGDRGRPGAESQGPDDRLVQSARQDAGERRTPRESFGERGSHGGPRGPWVPGGAKGAKQEVLQAAAKAINAFSNDGSFLQQFAAEPSSSPRGTNEARAPSPARSPSPMEDDEDERVQGTMPTPAAAPSGRVQGEPAPQGAGPAAGGEAGPPRPAGANFGAAAALRARLLGKPPPSTSEADAGRKKEVVVLPTVDARGRALPGAFGRDKAADFGREDNGRKAKSVQRYGEGGARERWFKDDDAPDLATLVKRQRHGDYDDLDANLADNIMRAKRFKGKELNADDEYDNDGGLNMYESRDSRMTKEKLAQRHKAKQVSEYRKATSATDNCTYCLASARRPRHLTVAIGQVAYLMLPLRGRLVAGHCQIVPAEHVASSRLADDLVWTEIRNFKKCLLQLFAAQGKGVIFMETALRLQDSRAHTLVDAVPVPWETLERARIVFKREIDDASSEWSQHYAKRMIDTRQKGLRGSIPDNFPYFFVEFGLSEGFVHVVDDVDRFKPDFGRSVLAGLLKLPAEDARTRAKAESAGLQKIWVEQFLKEFAPYDWTKQLDES